MKKLTSLKEYFSWLGINEEYSLQLKSCELCGSNESTLLLDYTEAASKILVPLPVSICNHCGLIMQNPALPSAFYQSFYEKNYDQMKTSSSYLTDSNPVKTKYDLKVFSEEFKSNIMRGNMLLNYLSYLYPELKNSSCQLSMLDVGCGSGAFLKVFSDAGWHSIGYDPDPSAVERSKQFSIDNIHLGDGESMSLKSQSLDLVIIIGSLEHCRNPNVVLQKCYEALKPNGKIVLEGRYEPVSYSYRWLNANHHRFLTNNTAKAFLMKHGFHIDQSTTYPVCGRDTGRPGGGFAFATKKDLSYADAKADQLLALFAENNCITDVKSQVEFIKMHDISCSISDQDPDKVVSTLSQDTLQNIML